MGTKSPPQPPSPHPILLKTRTIRKLVKRSNESSPEAGVAGRAELLDAEVLGLGLKLQQLPPGVRERDLAIPQEVQDRAKVFPVSVYKEDKGLYYNWLNALISNCVWNTVLVADRFTELNGQTPTEWQSFIY